MPGDNPFFVHKLRYGQFRARLPDNKWTAPPSSDLAKRSLSIMISFGGKRNIVRRSVIHACTARRDTRPHNEEAGFIKPKNRDVGISCPMKPILIKVDSKVTNWKGVNSGAPQINEPNTLKYPYWRLGSKHSLFRLRKWISFDWFLFFIRRYIDLKPFTWRFLT